MNWIEFLAEIPTQVLVAINGIIAGIGSSLVAFLVAKSTVKSEIEKMKLIWKREDDERFDLEFAEMLTSIQLCIDNKYWATYKDALEKINVLRAKTDGTMSSLLDSLYEEVAASGKHAPLDREKLKVHLGTLIEEKRKANN